MLNRLPVFRFAKRIISPSRFYFANNETSQPLRTDAPKRTDTLVKEEETPVHLRPYNKEKYEVPSEKIKYATGYALLDVEAFPRSKIMKICYIILDKLKELPAEALYRIYTEEKLKYIMKLADETDDIRTLEEQFGYESIEMFIQYLHKELELFEAMKDSKPWEPRPVEPDQIFHYSRYPRTALKHARLERPAREEKKFVQ